MTIEQQFFNEYRLMYRPFTNQLNMQLEHFQLYSSQWAVLRFLIDKGPHSLVEIASFMSIEKPSVTRLVQKLVELGYVETVAGKDKREKVVQLTPFGENIVQEVQEHLKPFLEKALAGVAKQDIETATRVLATICMNIHQ
ncbi:MarR family transcriptional regulator [Lysinibacillus sphaericus]|uniref:Transcriptional regulator n=1 Tax=Lysinibacillus sphaericus TaxID=1421 RepID=A0A2S0K1G0_LYSSH|nr:MarR family transcriptional regulator [Lysinibacillus sphaericus]AVK97225.1 transcriptional regulator [Lysinibacillus sphaericus]MED4542519.1 MarR family transcriptional regulator [Lysinibacillus sphaericus]TKI20088.1 MarR family transcriptional regulator [Lysinibacillus sphaericus]SUV16892.1 MarR family transcriptional regulator [Lysinibacillus sphaericus]GEC80303.1 putative HTH-type transcriptional regulator YwoH [Lysinibacillus sphaericus]